MGKCKLRNQRPKAFWGALITSLVPALVGGVGSIISSKKQADALREQQETQARIAREQQELANNNNLAATLNNYAMSENVIEQYDKYANYYRNGGKVLAGGKKVKLNNKSFLLRGNKHGMLNRVGGDGITLKYGKNEIDAQGGEVEYNKSKNVHYILSDEPELGVDGISPAKLAVLGGNLDDIVSVQETNKKRLSIKSPNSIRPKANLGMLIKGGDWINLGGDLISTLGGFLGSNLIANSLNFDYNLPAYTDVVSVSTPTDWDNAAKRQEVKRASQLAKRNIARNSASSAVALNRMQAVNTEELEELGKLWDERNQKRLELINANAEREQQTRLANAQLKSNYYNKVADLELQKAKFKQEVENQKAVSWNNLAQGIGTAITNFGTQGLQRYQDEQALIAALAGSENFGVVYDRLNKLGYNFPNNFKTRAEQYIKGTNNTQTNNNNFSLISPNKYFNFSLKKPITPYYSWLKQ